VPDVFATSSPRFKNRCYPLPVFPACYCFGRGSGRTFLRLRRPGSRTGVTRYPFFRRVIALVKERVGRSCDFVAPVQEPVLPVTRFSGVLLLRSRSALDVLATSSPRFKNRCYPVPVFPACYCLGRGARWSFLRLRRPGSRTGVTRYPLENRWYRSRTGVTFFIS
jgi:hypothetical protein